MRILIVVVRRNAPARRIATRRLPPLRHADEYCWEDRPTAVHAAVVVGTVQRPELPPVIYAYKDAACCRRPSAVDQFQKFARERSEEHTSELQSRSDLVSRLLLCKK